MPTKDLELRKFRNGKKKLFISRTDRRGGNFCVRSLSCYNFVFLFKIEKEDFFYLLSVIFVFFFFTTSIAIF